MSRLLFITQQADPAHPALAATLPMIAALARRVDRVDVLALGAVPEALPANCRVRTFGARTQVARGARFAAALTRELAHGRPDAIVAHMSPLYAVLAAPFARPLGVPILLWFTQRSVTRRLRAAVAVSSAVLTVDERSFPFATSKLRPIGHGIDLTEFPCVERPAHGGPFRLLALGRYGRVKGYDVVLRALAAATTAGLDARLTVHGPTLTADDERHLAELRGLAAELRLGERVALAGAVVRTDVPGLLAQADALVSATRSGSADKVVFEAASACLPVLASAPSFDELLPAALRFADGDPAALAERLGGLSRLDATERAALGRALREHVAARHSVDTWAAGVLAAAGLA